MKGSFARSALTSIFTTALDLSVLTALVEAFHVNYVLATFLGTVLGATSNFLINRRWAFVATDGHAGHQAGPPTTTVKSTSPECSISCLSRHFSGIRFFSQ